MLCVLDRAVAQARTRGNHARAATGIMKTRVRPACTPRADRRAVVRAAATALPRTIAWAYSRANLRPEHVAGRRARHAGMFTHWEARHLIKRMRAYTRIVQMAFRQGAFTARASTLKGYNTVEARTGKSATEG